MTQLDLSPYHVKRLELSVDSGCIFRGSRIIIPLPGRKQILAELHQAHPGICRMKSLARGYVWWPGIDKDLEAVVKNCDTCQSHRRSPPLAPIHPWQWPEVPWSRIHIDFAGPFMGGMYLIVVDAHSKWLEVHLMPSTTSTATIDKLRQIFSTFGLPKVLVSDNASVFASHEFETFMTENGISHIRVAPYHPASKGLAERAVQTFKEGMKKLQGPKECLLKLISRSPGLDEEEELYAPPSHA